MKFLACLILVIVTVNVSLGQQIYLDSLRKQLNDAQREDTFRVKALCRLADYYGFVQFDSCLFYATQGADLSDKLNYEYGRFLSYRSRFFAFNCNGNYPRALEEALNFDRAYEQLKKTRLNVGTPHYFVGLLYREMADYSTAIETFRETIRSQKEDGTPQTEDFFTYSQMGLIYLSLKNLDSALWYTQLGYDLGLRSGEYKKYFSLAIGALGTVHVALQHYKIAEDLFRYGIQQSGQFNNIYFQARNYYNLATLFQKENLRDSSIYYGTIALQLSLAHNFGEFTLDASKLLTSIYESKGLSDSTLKYMRILLAAKDSVFSQSRGQQFRQFAFNEVQRQQKINAEKERYQTRVKLLTLMAILGVVLLMAFILYRSGRQRQKAKVKIEQAYAELKSTQAQLIQSEKMASLGELTAGIAHEIQNPLNFVNNFSEVNNELIEEVKSQKEKLKSEELDAVLNDIYQNNEKISFHGKRADAIVKGMLQHSRSSSSQKEPTDINALCDEYLRLAYHGLRAKDKSFNAEMETSFDTSIDRINIVPQDVGRVLLNLFNNAFYAVKEKQKTADKNFKPTVSVQTKKINDKIEIVVEDNGNGIPDSIREKIFQPFFTTKPTGQGTGLGLSLAYDIVKAHGGELKVEMKEGEGSAFFIVLPQ